MLEAGVKAPEFKLQDKDGNLVSLSDFKNKKIEKENKKYDEQKIERGRYGKRTGRSDGWNFIKKVLSRGARDAIRKRDC